MKSLIALALLVSSSAFALSPIPNTAYKSTEVLNCNNGVEILSVQVLTNAYGADDFAVGTFIDYRKNGAVVYSSSSFNAPKFLAVGAGSYTVTGNGTEANRQIVFGYDYMSYNVTVQSYTPGTSYSKVLLSVTNCQPTGAISKFSNIGNPRPIIDPAPVKKPAPPKSAYRKI